MKNACSGSSALSPVEADAAARALDRAVSDTLAEKARRIEAAAAAECRRLDAEVEEHTRASKAPEPRRYPLDGLALLAAESAEELARRDAVTIADLLRRAREIEQVAQRTGRAFASEVAKALGVDVGAGEMATFGKHDGKPVLVVRPVTEAR